MRKGRVEGLFPILRFQRTAREMGYDCLLSPLVRVRWVPNRPAENDLLIPLTVRSRGRYRIGLPPPDDARDSAPRGCGRRKGSDRYLRGHPGRMPVGAELRGHDALGFDGSLQLVRDEVGGFSANTCVLVQHTVLSMVIY